MTNVRNSVPYTGVTNDLIRRVLEHRSKKMKGFTRLYNVEKLVYFEATERMEDAIAREKQIKGGSRKDKIDLIKSINPQLKDLFEDLISA
ncbi:MAG: GIY-YIG nuclease family protein [Anaerolineales bacterium]